MSRQGPESREDRLYRVQRMIDMYDRLSAWLKGREAPKPPKSDYRRELKVCLSKLLDRIRRYGYRRGPDQRWSGDGLPTLTAFSTEEPMESPQERRDAARQSWNSPRVAARRPDGSRLGWSGDPDA